jgi:hypothetical protein
LTQENLVQDFVLERSKRRRAAIEPSNRSHLVQEEFKFKYKCKFKAVKLL